MNKDFMGAKLALFFDDKLIVFLRDNKEGLSFANMWDFPGGGREGDETSLQCIQREVKEEFGIELEPAAIVWEKEYPSMLDPTKSARFMVANASKSQLDSITFGAEGQRWQLMSVQEFLSRDDAVPHLKGRLQDYLNLSQTSNSISTLHE